MKAELDLEFLRGRKMFRSDEGCPLEPPEKDFFKLTPEAAMWLGWMLERARGIMKEIRAKQRSDDVRAYIEHGHDLPPLDGWYG